MANGKIIYPSGEAEQVTYVFPKNYNYGHKPGARINLNADQRAFDGTLHRYTGPAKKQYELQFTNVDKVQADYFLTLWDFQCPIDLYLDGTNLDAVVMMTECPEPQSQPFFNSSGEHTYSFEVIMEEV